MTKRALTSARSRACGGLAALAMVGASTMAAPRPAAAATGTDSATTSNLETAFEWAIDVERGRVGLPALQVDPALSNQARAWSGGMAYFRTLAHDHSYGAELSASDPNWQAGGENVGQGPTAQSIELALMASPPHRANILGNFTRMGVGVFIDGSGRLWVTERFYR